jgi:hypothetical protein
MQGPRCSAVASSPRKIWAALPAIVRATLHAAWAASKVGAISFAALFTICNLALGIYEAAAGLMKILELLGGIVGGAAIFVLALLFSFVITVPVSSIVAACAYPFLRTQRTANPIVFGIVGFVVGVSVGDVVECPNLEFIFRLLDFLFCNRRPIGLCRRSRIRPPSSQTALTARLSPAFC